MTDERPAAPGADVDQQGVPSLGWMKSFPRPGAGVLLPVTDRRAAALGVTMYTASKPRVIAAQRIACTVIGLAGTRVLPGRRQLVELPCSPEEWTEMTRQWAALVGPVASFAVYRRREASRTGLTMIGVDARGRPLGVFKVRPTGGPLVAEQRALAAVHDAAPATFRAPRDLGSGSHGAWHWSIQETVFTRPHAPVFVPPPGIFDEIREIAGGLVEPGPGVPAHGDVAPWNLRRDHRGQVWLYDWENVGRFPPEADRTYLAVSARVLHGTPLPSDLPDEAVGYWRHVWLDRQRWEADGDPLPDQMLEALDEAQRLHPSRGHGGLRRVSELIASRSVQPQATLTQRARVRLREGVGLALNLVPLRSVEWARERHVLTPVLRHRSISGLGTFTVAGDPPIVMEANDSRLVRLLYWGGQQGYEREEAALWARLCSRSENILEVGANIGYYSVVGALAAPNATYTAVEAHPESARIVQHNLDLNHVTHVRLINAAAVGEAGIESVELALPDLEHYTAPTGAFVSDGSEGVPGRRATSKSLVVPAVDVSTLAEHVDLVKLDIEGSEHRVLAPVIETLVENRATILVEVLRDTPKLRELLAGLHDRGYEFLLAGHGMPQVSVADLLRVDLLEAFGSRDIVAVHAERRAIVDA